jgi:hypothetical protein
VINFAVRPGHRKDHISTPVSESMNDTLLINEFDDKNTSVVLLRHDEHSEPP